MNYTLDQKEAMIKAGKMTAIVSFDAVKGKYVAKTHDGKLLAQSTSVGHVVHIIDSGICNKAKKFGVKFCSTFKDGVEVPADVAFDDVVRLGGGGKVNKTLDSVMLDELAAKWDINQRFEFMEQLINMTLNGKSRALIISGPGGLGKSHTVMAEIKKHGLVAASYMEPAKPSNDRDEDDLVDDIVDAAMIGGDFIVIKGFSSPAALYRTLYEFREKTIVFDDCDNIMRHPDAINLLKAALDTTRERYVHWNSQPIGGSDIPRMFCFTGQVIFISNMAVSKIDQALRTRAFVIDLQMTQDQRLQRMEKVLDSVAAENDLDENVVKDAYDFLTEFKDKVKDLNFRSLLNVAKIRDGVGKKNWKDLAEYSINCMQ